jgi:hypothetical protein
VLVCSAPTSARREEAHQDKPTGLPSGRSKHGQRWLALSLCRTVHARVRHALVAAARQKQVSAHYVDNLPVAYVHNVPDDPDLL